MQLILLAGSANRPLAEAVAQDLGEPLGECLLHRFPDGELHVEVRTSLRGHDVYLLQPTSPPVAEHLLEVLLLADACWRAGATQITAIIPYFGYARQDRRATGREAVGARLVADLLAASHVGRVVALDLHATALEGFFASRIEHLTAVPLLTAAVRAAVPPKSVVVAPDLGAVKLADRYAKALDLPVAVVYKVRVSGDQVRVSGIVGEVRDRTPILVDDMISTGGTIEAAARVLLDQGCVPQLTVVATHALLVGPATERLSALPLQTLIATDSVAVPMEHGLPLRLVHLGPFLAEVVRRLHTNTSLSDFLVHA